MILRGDLEPGQHLTEDRLAEQLGVSRNPVREAIRLLEATGLVEVIPRRGAYVCHPDIENVKSLLELRSVLEGFAAEQAAIHRPEETGIRLTAIIEQGIAATTDDNHVLAAELHRDFHRETEAASGNPYLAQVLGPLRQQTEVVFSILLERRGPVSWHEHEAIRDAIASGEPEAARTMVYHHILSVLDEMAALDGTGAEEHETSPA